MKQWDQVMAASISFTGHRKNENSRAPFREKQRGGLYQGLGYAKVRVGHCHLAETFLAVQLAWFMEGWRCAANSFITMQGVRHNLRSNEKYEYFTEYIPSLASQGYLFYESVCGLCSFGHWRLGHYFGNWQQEQSAQLCSCSWVYGSSHKIWLLDLKWHLI